EILQPALGQETAVRARRRRRVAYARARLRLEIVALDVNVVPAPAADELQFFRERERDLAEHGEIGALVPLAGMPADVGGRQRAAGEEVAGAEAFRAGVARI